ncbi:hypothetical protein BC936DRAFT_144019 [Jimgerdemannia flammicorona]|uniref:Uncharacterized protein n=1 Tax=Jimgerdemannia flammicorona TaxID=994334 RepID=A0A432ZY65_9FUNG|nr:hypothetical protein BC936DRAFT_144019 [Jimgerdemannia flammicorona]
MNFSHGSYEVRVGNTGLYLAQP